LLDKLGKAILGAGMRHSFLQRSFWGKVGDCLDAFERVEWTRMTGEELRRARNHHEFSLNR